VVGNFFISNKDSIADSPPTETTAKWGTFSRKGGWSYVEESVAS